MPNTVDASTIKRLDSIFSKNQWPIIDSGPLGEGNLFDEFCELLSFLNDEERELVLQLTENFKRYTLVDYPILCDNVFKKIDKNFLQSKKNIYVIPLNSPKDVLRGKIKSGGNVAYLLKDPILPRYLIRSKQRIIDVADVIKLHELYANRKDSLIIFFDDFIGTGQTALEVIEYYNNNTKIEQESILVASLVALKSGYDSIADMGVNVAADIIMLKGISESTAIENKVAALKIVDRIEKRLRITEKFFRGYGQSEALVKMIRTPNNTFPLYWCDKTKKGDKWPAPFPRKR